MARFAFALVLTSFLAACASQGPGSPYGSPEGQRERAGQATQELDRSAAGK